MNRKKTNYIENEKKRWGEGSEGNFLSSLIERTFNALKNKCLLNFFIIHSSLFFFFFLSCLRHTTPAGCYRRNVFVLSFHFSFCYSINVCPTYTLILFYLTPNPQRNRSLFASKNILKHTHFPPDGRCCLDTNISVLLLLWAFLLSNPHSTPTANTSDCASHSSQAYSFDYSNALWYSVLLHYTYRHTYTAI